MSTITTINNCNNKTTLSKGEPMNNFLPKIAFHLVKVFYKDSFLCVLGGEGGVQNKVTEESKGFKEFLTSLLTSKHDRLNETHITLNLFVILKL